MVAPEVVVTEVAVCFDVAAQWFVVRCRARAHESNGEARFETLASPLSRRQLEAESGGPELASFLMEHPGSWWRMPVSQRIEEGHGV